MIRRQVTKLGVATGMLVAIGCGEAVRAPAGRASNQPSRALAPEPATGESAAEIAAGRMLDRTFDDLKFDIEPGDWFERTMLTEPIEKMLGERIRIRGYILPTARKRLRQFVLVRDNQECCFGPGAALYDCILVDMQPGALADFSVRPVTVEGELTIDEFLGPDGMHLAIYHLDGEQVY